MKYVTAMVAMLLVWHLASCAQLILSSPTASGDEMCCPHKNSNSPADAATGTQRSLEHPPVAFALGWILDTSPYPPRWQCGDWAASIGWLHIISDVTTWLAYLAIPAMLIYFARKRERMPFSSLFWLFGAFIFVCGTTHLMEAVVFWWPAYGLSGIIKLGTAVVSVTTAVALFYAIPQALTFRSPQESEEEVRVRTMELEIAREQANRIVEASPVGMIMVNEAGTIVLTNAAVERLFGYARGELQGLPVEVLVPDEFRAEHPGLRQQFFKEPAIRDMGRGRDLFGVHKSGDAIPVEIGLNPVNTDKGVCILCNVVDLQERKKAAQALRTHATRLAAANEDLEQFAYAASHDLKSPLRAIDNLAKWLAKDLASKLPGRSAQHLEQLQGRVGRMEALLDDLLSYSRVGRETSNTEPVDCRALVQDVFATLDIPRGFRVVCDVNLPMIQARKAALRQVLMNLVSNAIKHHHRSSGRVCVTAVEGESDIQLFVEDDGPGIPTDLHERAFKPFQTLQPRDEVEGTGLGLAIVKKLVENEGGDIRLTSSTGQGARFCIRWPKLASHELHLEGE